LCCDYHIEKAYHDIILPVSFNSRWKCILVMVTILVIRTYCLKVSDPSAIIKGRSSLNLQGGTHWNLATVRWFKDQRVMTRFLITSNQ
jgi:hypothetical protein